MEVGRAGGLSAHWYCNTKGWYVVRCIPATVSVSPSHQGGRFHKRGLEGLLRISSDQLKICKSILTCVWIPKYWTGFKKTDTLSKCCAESILYCGRQCIALWGDVGKLDQMGNPGNFLSLMKVLANHDPILKNHLERPRLQNATYLSPQTQNEIIDIIGNFAVLLSHTSNWWCNSCTDMQGSWRSWHAVKRHTWSRI